MKKSFLFIVISLFLLPSCSLVFVKMYGFKRVKSVDDKMIAKFGSKYNIPPEDAYSIGTDYVEFIQTIDTTKFKQEKKNHYQPLQVLYYDTESNLISYHVNCYVGGFPNLEWNKSNSFDVFPPTKQAPLDSVLSLQTHLEFLKPLSNTQKTSIKNYDYVVIIYWNKLMGRQSKRFIKIIQKNLKLAVDKKIKVFYVNNDVLYLNDGL